MIVLQCVTVKYFLQSPVVLPTSPGTEKFLLQSVEADELCTDIPAKISPWPYLNGAADNFATLALKLRSKATELQAIELIFCPHSATVGNGRILYETRGKRQWHSLTLFNPATLASIDFTTFRSFAYHKIPKYFSPAKHLPWLQSVPEHALFAVSAFPNRDTAYLGHQDYDFYKHTLILGGSGSGKSKLLAAMVAQLAQDDTSKQRIVIIDPHDALRDDVTGVAHRTVVDFQTLENSAGLFQISTSHLTANIELLLTTFKNLLADNYNSRLERVLRYSSFLLLTAQNFSFMQLRQLLLDLDFRNQLLQTYADVLPTHVSHFFLTDFNELKTKSYDLAIAPIISFIDEMQLVPAFQTTEQLNSTAQIIDQHFLTVFSLNRLLLGDRIVRTVAALLFQQLFLYAEQHSPDIQLTIIIDEVAVVEQPILARFLSELRKYHTNIVLAGQYFDQISLSLRASILANVVNYYLFRVARFDAELLNQSLDLKLVGEATPEDRVTTLTKLKSRECVLQLSHHEKVYSAVQARTLDYFTPPPESELAIPAEPANPGLNSPGLKTDFEEASSELLIDDDVDIGALMQQTSTSRKILEHI